MTEMRRTYFFVGRHGRIGDVSPLERLQCRVLQRNEVTHSSANFTHNQPVHAFDGADRDAIAGVGRRLSSGVFVVESPRSFTGPITAFSVFVPPLAPRLDHVDESAHDRHSQ